MKLIVEEWNDNTGFEYRTTAHNPTLDAQVRIEDELVVVVRAIENNQVVSAIRFNNSFNHDDELVVYGRLVQPQPVYETFGRWRIKEEKK